MTNFLKYDCHSRDREKAPFSFGHASCIHHNYVFVCVEASIIAGIWTCITWFVENALILHHFGIHFAPPDIQLYVLLDYGVARSQPIVCAEFFVPRHVARMSSHRLVRGHHTKFLSSDTGRLQAGPGPWRHGAFRNFVTIVHFENWKARLLAYSLCPPPHSPPPKKFFGNGVCVDLSVRGHR